MHADVVDLAVMDLQLSCSSPIRGYVALLFYALWLYPNMILWLWKFLCKTLVGLAANNKTSIYSMFER